MKLNDRWRKKMGIIRKFTSRHGTYCSLQVHTHACMHTHTHTHTFTKSAKLLLALCNINERISLAQGQTCHIAAISSTTSQVAMLARLARVQRCPVIEVFVPLQ